MDNGSEGFIGGLHDNGKRRDSCHTGEYNQAREHRGNDQKR